MAVTGGLVAATPAAKLAEINPSEWWLTLRTTTYSHKIGLRSNRNTNQKGTTMNAVATVTAGTVKIGRNVLQATKDSEGTVTYQTAKGEKFATAKVAKTFTPDLAKMTPEQVSEIGNKDVAKPEAPKALPHNGKAAVKKAAPVVVTSEDLTLLVFVAAHQRSPKFRHLDHCPHFEASAKFVKVEDADKLSALKPCPDCSRNAARSRVAK